MTCGEGYHVRSRACDNPKPEGKGQECAGLDYETKHCNMTECPGKLSVIFFIDVIMFNLTCFNIKHFFMIFAYLVS